MRRDYRQPREQIDLALRRRKILYVLIVVLCFFGFIAVRLFYLQVSQNKLFLKLGERNFLRTELIPSRRGNVFDCNNNLLATNRPVFDLYWKGGGKSSLTHRQEDFVRIVKEILGEKVLDDLMVKQIERAERFSRSVLIKSDITQEELFKVSEQCSESINLFLEKHFKRVYPYNNMASHVLGYLRKAERSGNFEGFYGLEREIQADLEGEWGYVRHVTNAMGKRLRQQECQEAIAGTDVVLTLDLTLQSMAEMLFEPGQSGAFIIMDPEDGSIKAMLSYPNFDPNLFLEPISDQEWSDKFTIDSPLLNRAIHASYPPASIFKLVTFVAGLERGVISTNSSFFCPGYTLFCGRRYNCQHREGHGRLTATQALGASCNVPCFQIAQKITIDQLADYAMRFGLGQSTSFVVSDKKGLVPTSGWKQSCKGERWWPGETLSASIGQSFLLVTPLQIVRMVASICSGYLVKPRIMQAEQVEKTPLDVSGHTLSFLRHVMREVVLHGTGAYLSRFSEFHISAKTGTAQTISLEKQQKETKKQLEHAWFAAYFSYKNTKPLAMVILSENAGSSRFALKIAEKFFTIYRKVL
jgi:penicillin-binding protein 2